MTPDFDAGQLHVASHVMLAELLRMEADLKLLKGKDNRAAMERLIGLKRVAYEFHCWNMLEMGI